MTPPLTRVLRPTDFKDTESAVAAIIETLNNFQRDVISCLTNGIDSVNLAQTKRKGVNFTTDSDGVASVSVLHGLPKPPEMVGIGLRRKNGATLGASWGWAYEWIVEGDTVLLSFVDMPLSIDVVATVVME